MEEIIGGNAGKIWSVLSKQGPLSASALGRATSLKASELDRAIGWLAREGKLTFSPDAKGTIKIGLKPSVV
ncbi:MAG: winged helix-turn-helix domain-containing protein [Planctomycetota bacterium]|nr:winged helix-turn-helix domain-containing protein [Planctomycetota bacterium]